ncbi:MAG: hypothetical protein ACREQA_04750 [Candidatus Binatia bacterium]
MGLVTYGWWIFQVERGHQALRKGDNTAAAEIFASAESLMHRFPWLTRLLKEDYQKLVFTQVGILYAQGGTNEVMEKLQEEAGRAPFLAESGEFSFWSGNALVRHAVQSKNPEASMNALKAALAEYQKGLAAEPDDWDLKYNYELVKLILSQKDRDKKKEEEKVKSILEKMRPVVEPSREQLPPEKRG